LDGGTNNVENDVRDDYLDCVVIVIARAGFMLRMQPDFTVEVYRHGRCRNHDPRIDVRVHDDTISLWQDGTIRLDVLAYEDPAMFPKMLKRLAKLAY
jgi:hypothetical protein